MKLNKKYKPNFAWCFPKKTGERVDAFFPLFVPVYRKFSDEELAFYYYALIFARNMELFANKNYLPLAIHGVEYSDYQLGLACKKQMPFFAQLKRLSQLEQKMRKKNQIFLEQVFPDFLVQKKDLKDQEYSAIAKALSLVSEKGLLKQDFRLIYRDPTTQAILSPDDIEWKKQKVWKLEIKCFVETKKEVLPLIVDDLLTFFADQAVIVHSEDRRYKKHIGKKIILPIINKSIPIYAQDGIDTLTDNWILRVNPLLNQDGLERAKSYNLDLQHTIIDQQGKINAQLQDFSGQSLENFEENIIESLDMIGNLSSKQEEERLIPYSKITGERLIKRVERLYAIELWEEYSRFRERLEVMYPQFLHLFSAQDERFLVESKGKFLSRISEEKAEKLSALNFDALLSEDSSIFELLLVTMGAFGYCWEKMKLEDVIDMLYLLPQEVRSELAKTTSRFSPQQIFEYQQKLLSADSEELFDYLLQELSSIAWVQKWDEKSEFFLLFHKLFDQYQLKFPQLDTTFIKAAQLWNLHTSLSEQLAFFAPYPKNLLLILLILLFLSQDQKQIIGLREFKALKYQWLISEKIQQFAQEYGRDALYLTMANQSKIDEKNLLSAQAYLQHLRNLFKFLYEHSAFCSWDGKPHLRAIDMRAYTQWAELFQSYQNYQKTWTWLSELLQQLQVFTQGEFSRYLEFLKNENQQAFHVAAEIFLQILQVFQPYLPFLIQEIATLLERPLRINLDQTKKEGQKDYKLNLLFEVVKGIADYKKQLQIKKHQAIKLYIQASMERAALLQEHLPLLKILLKIQEIEVLSNAESFAPHLQVFQLLDMQAACALLAVHKESDSLLALEKKLSDIQQHLEYIRQTLMMLSTSPIPQPQKIAEKEQEMQVLKQEMEDLEIKIKKIKAQKK